jgi:hypothetical protein
MKKTVELQTEHIASLLSDLEVYFIYFKRYTNKYEYNLLKGAESDNLKLKEHLSNLRDKLAEATEALAETTADLTKSQKINLDIKSMLLLTRPVF